jgi:hypothetical protein
MPQALIQPSFAGGELAPSLHARVDLAKYAVGLRRCRNFFVHAHGGASNRTGTQFIGEVADSSVRGRLIPFAFNTTQTYVLEFGALCMRVIKDGGYVESSPGVIYELATPYAAADLAALKYEQSNDVMTLTHPSHAPRELSRTGHAAWTLSTISFEPSIDPPGTVAATPTETAEPTTEYRYVVTAVSSNGLEESVASDHVEVTSTKLGTALGSSPYRYPEIVVTWSDVAGAERYNVYKLGSGLYGYIGSSDTTSFKDTNLLPDETDTPPATRNPFDGSGNYPATVTFYEQRRVFANSTNKPQTIWGTGSGAFRNMNVSTPTKDDDAFEVTIAGRQVNAIRHLVPLTALIALTAGGEFTIDSGSNSDAIGPGSIRIKPQGYRGAADVRPLVIGNTVLFVQEKGAIVRDLGYTYESDSYTGNNLSILAAHLFTGYQVEEWAYAQAPYSLVWAVRSDGTLLCLTYEREQQVWAWSRHDTDNGAFESVAVVSEGQEDAVYFIVRRTIDGETKRYVERLHSRQFEAVEDCFFVDSGLSYDGAATAILTGLEHLEGETVAILGDGNVFGRLTVTGGQITLPRAVSKAHVGLPITAQMHTLDPEVNPGTVQGKRKRVASVTARVEASRGMWAGPAETDLVELKPEGLTVYGGPIPLKTGDCHINIPPQWDEHGSVFIEQRDPLPLTVLALIPEIEVGT